MSDGQFSEESIMYHYTNHLNALLTHIFNTVNAFLKQTNKKIGRTSFISLGSQVM